MAEDSMFQEAIQALHENDRARARDLLTRLLKADQSNATYWLYLSTAVESKKERIYCLKTALALDPQNPAAMRGLRLLGAIPPDDSVPPFPLNRPRTWEENLSEIPKPKGFKAAWANPLSRFFILLAFVGLIALVIALVFLFPRAGPMAWVRTKGPSPTYTMTVTSLPAQSPLLRTPTPTFIGPTPLWMMLPEPYTPTPLYVEMEHSPSSSDAFSAGIRYFRNEDYVNAINLMQQVATLEPEAVDAFFYMGEAYRLIGNYPSALQAFERAIAINPAFGPGYYGRAVIRRLIDSGANVSNDLERAISLDPDFLLPYIERADFFLDNNRPEEALEDLAAAQVLAPDSPLVYYNLALVYLELGDAAQALEAASEANELDMTLLSVYLVLGKAYHANGQVELAVGALQTYTLYQPEHAEALALLGAAYVAAGDYPSALEVLNAALSLDSRNSQAYTQRGMVHLSMGEGQLAEDDFMKALLYQPQNFEASIGLVRAHILQEHFGNAYNQISQHTSRLPNLTDDQKAELYYWQAVALDGLGLNASATTYWRLLLDLPLEVVPEEWRVQALERLGLQSTATPTRTPTP